MPQRTEHDDLEEQHGEELGDEFSERGDESERDPDASGELEALLEDEEECEEEEEGEGEGLGLYPEGELPPKPDSLRTFPLPFLAQPPMFQNPRDGRPSLLAVAAATAAVGFGVPLARELILKAAAKEDVGADGKATGLSHIVQTLLAAAVFGLAERQVQDTGLKRAMQALALAVTLARPINEAVQKVKPDSSFKFLAEGMPDEDLLGHQVLFDEIRHSRSRQEQLPAAPLPALPSPKQAAPVVIAQEAVSSDPEDDLGLPFGPLVDLTDADELWDERDWGN